MSLDFLVYIYVGFVLYFFLIVNQGLKTNFYALKSHKLKLNYLHMSFVDVSGDRIGLAITQSLSLTGILQYGVIQRKYLHHNRFIIEKYAVYNT